MTCWIRDNHSEGEEGSRGGNDGSSEGDLANGAGVEGVGDEEAIVVVDGLRGEVRDEVTSLS